MTFLVGKNEGKTKANVPFKQRLQGAKETFKEFTLRPTDTLWTVAKRFGNGEYDDWKMLYNIASNKNTIANNLRNLQGQTLQIPKVWQ